jgi:hypothetical protein
METAKRRRAIWAIMASVIAHLAVLTVVVLQKPMLRIPDDTAGPPQAIIPILIMPKTPSAGAPEAPAPIRLHRRPQRFAPPELPIAPLIVPPAPAPGPSAPAPRAPVAAFHPSPLPEGPKADVRTALRQGTVGCANPNAVGLTAAERAACDEKLGKAGKDASFPGLGLAAGKEAAFDKAAEHKEACRAYRASPGGAQPPLLRDGPC